MSSTAACEQMSSETIRKQKTLAEAGAEGRVEGIS